MERRLLEVGNLTVSFPTPDGIVQAARGVSFDVADGETLGIVGESGSGKTATAMALLSLARGARVTGVARFEGRDLLSLPEEDLRDIRGAGIAMIFQDPLTSLHPLYRVGWQITEMIRAHSGISRQAAQERAAELLALVGMPEPRRRLDDYPHQLSGGMRQRVMIAMALALKPSLLIADEPTTALDATVQAQILDLLVRIQQELGTALVVITHDLGVIAQIADTVLVMYAGRIVEKADRRTLFYRPHHPYTLGLLRSVPTARNGSAGRPARLQPIQGQPPSLIDLPTGCKFHPRCPYVMKRCRVEEPPLRPMTAGFGHASACWLPDRTEAAA